VDAATLPREKRRVHSSQPRVVVVTRPTEYEWLLQRHATRQQAAFFLKSRGQSLEATAARHEAFAASRKVVVQGIPVDWRRASVTRDDLDRFLFEPGDVVVALGQDGLVANVAKYLDGQPVIGLNPDPERYEGVLVPHPPVAAADLIRSAGLGRGDFELRSMVTARLTDGQALTALNEIFVGHRAHQSAKYQIEFEGLSERHSSSGLIVATGTGATGWARSIARERRCELPMPRPEDRRLIFFVREAWPSVFTGTECTDGLLGDSTSLTITSRMDEGVIFGDGIEADRIDFGWGRRVELTLAGRALRLMRS
jgi:NAD kinase